MSFDIFNINTSLFAWVAGNTEIVAMVCVVAVIMGVVFTVYNMGVAVYDGDTPVKSKMKDVLQGFGLTVVVVWMGTLLSWSLSVTSVPDNVTEVKQAIQQEYGFELTDESIQSLYDNHDSTGEALYVEDTSGQFHQYVVIGNEFHFLTEE